MTTSANVESTAATVGTPSGGVPENPSAHRARASLLTYLGDLHAVVVNGVQTLTRQLEFLQSPTGKGHPQAIRVVTDALQMLREHEIRLDTRAKVLGHSTTRPLKDAVLAVLGAAAGLIDAVRPKDASKALRDDYGYLCYLSVGYLMLHTTASGVGDHQTALIAEQCYRDEARLIIETAKVIPLLVLQELQQDGIPVAAVQDQCVRLVTQTWIQEQRSANQLGAVAPS